MRTRKDVAIVTIAGCAFWISFRWWTGEDVNLGYYGGWACGACVALFFHWKVSE